MDVNKLTSEEEDVIIHKKTEAPFQGIYTDFDEEGTYSCKHCGASLYQSSSKFHSGCGWPSFDEALEGAVKQVPDKDGKRVEILCNRCGGHLGHVFQGEWFTEKNIRHCVNSLSLQFVSKKNAKNISLLFLFFLLIQIPVFASESEESSRSFLPDFSVLWKNITHQIIKTPKHLFINISRFVMDHLIYFGWGLLLIGTVIGLYLMFVYLANRPKVEYTPNIQTNQPRSYQADQFYGTTILVTHANGFSENIPMYYNQMIIGKNSSCQIVLQDNNIAEQQAEIYAQEGRYFVRDFGTGYPTYVNGSMITDITELFAGYYVQMGGSTIQL